MKTYKKILLGLGGGVAVLAGGLVFTNRVSALDATDLNGARFTLISLNTIQVQLRGAGSQAGPTYNFIDSNINDNNEPGQANYRYSGALLDGGICSNYDDEGITVNGWPPPESTTQSSMLARLNVRLVPTANFEDCIDLSEAIATIDRSIQVIIPADGASGDSTNPRPSESTDETCEAKWSNPLTWIACPLFNIAADLTNFLLDLFEKQLCFRTEDSSNPYIECQTTDTDSIKPAWNAIKNIVSALLIIILLIAIFAQAVSIGPIDAYTLRKLLPRLVAAVILIQISWYLFSWVVNVVDDIGEGLMALLEGIFSSSASVNINNLNQLLGHAGIGDGTAALVNWTFILGLIVFGVIALPMLLLMLFTAVVALLVALAVLIFRKVIIITLLLLAPIALLLWILPNTENYWKMWWQNFVKVLLMFPLIVLIIEAGRIFAYVAGPTATGVAAPDVFIRLFIVMVGFFGPLFIIPKTYKWGGALMQAVGNAGFRFSDRYLAGEKAGANKYFRARQQDWNEQRRRASVDRVRNKVGFNPKAPWRYPLDQFRSGRWDPLKQTPGYRDVARRSVQKYIETGEKVHEEDVEAARQKLLAEGQRFRAMGRDWDQYFQMRGEGVRKYTDSNTGDEIDLGETSELEQIAAMKQTAILGSSLNWRYLENKAREMNEMSDRNNAKYNPDEALKLRKFFDDNVQTIMPKLPSVYIGLGSAAESNAATIGQMHGVEVESIISNLSEKIRTAGSPEAKANVEKQLVTFLQNFQEAAENENIAVDNLALRAVKGFLDSTEGEEFRAAINLAPRDGVPSRYGREPMGVTTLPDSGTLTVSDETRSELSRLKTEVSDKIDKQTGSYTGGGAAAAPTAATGAPVAGGGEAEGLLRIEHTQLDTPGVSGVTGVTPRNEAYVQNELVNLRRRVAAGETLSPDEQRRLEQLRTSFPHL